MSPREVTPGAPEVTRPEVTPSAPQVTLPAPALEVTGLEGAMGALSLRVSLRAGHGPLLIAGPNGAGKSTLLGLLLGVRRPQRGRICVAGRVLFDAEAGIDLPPEQRGLGFVPQRYALFPQHTALGNVAFGLRGRVPRALADQRALSLLEALEVGHLAGRLPATLSAGERQRVALARALAPEPCALLLDEPLAALDTSVRVRVRAFLAARLAALSLPALVVTHDPADVAALGDRVLILEQGRVVQEGSLAEIGAAPATAFAAAFAAAALAGRGPP